MKYALLNVSSADARVLERILRETFTVARERSGAEDGTEVRILRAMLQRLTRLDV